MEPGDPDALGPSRCGVPVFHPAAGSPCLVGPWSGRDPSSGDSGEAGRSASAGDHRLISLFLRSPCPQRVLCSLAVMMPLGDIREGVLKNS